VSRLGSVYIRRGEPEGELAGCCEVSEWAANEIERLDAEIVRLIEELNTERMRSVACGVIAMANTPESAARYRNMAEEYKCASADDVARAVDREMMHRADVQRLTSENAVLRKLLCAISLAVIEAIDDEEFGRYEMGELMTRMTAALNWPDSGLLEGGRDNDK
jgi:hypothetical protein